MAATSSIRIMIGEDDGVVALDLQNQLCRMGYVVEARADSLREVVHLALELKPDVLLVDVNIEGNTNGFQVAREIRSMADIPIVFLSAFAKDIVENASFRHYRYVTKPFNVAELHAAIQGASGVST